MVKKNINYQKIYLQCRKFYCFQQHIPANSISNKIPWAEYKYMIKQSLPINTLSYTSDCFIHGHTTGITALVTFL